MEMGGDLDDAVIYRDKKHKDQLEVAIGDGMEFTIHGNFKQTRLVLLCAGFLGSTAPTHRLQFLSYISLILSCPIILIVY